MSLSSLGVKDQFLVVLHNNICIISTSDHTFVCHWDLAWTRPIIKFARICEDFFFFFFFVGGGGECLFLQSIPLTGRHGNTPVNAQNCLVEGNERQTVT